VATRYGCAIQGATEVALTNLDVLGLWREIPIAFAYSIGGQRTTRFPTTGQLADAKPVFEVMPGWRSDITAIRAYRKLPDAARRYVERIEDLVEKPIRLISVGPKREQILIKE
jgi:adenylosuccinate synthase